MTSMPYPLPFDEERRQRVLDDAAVLDTPPSPHLDALTQLAAERFQAKIAILSLVDRERQWFKSRVGLDACETGRDVAFCAYTVLQDTPFVVLDAKLDPRFSANPLVTGAPFIRFYAGAPVIVEGASIGSFCVIDDQPRAAFSADDQRTLEAFADIASRHIEAIQFADLTRAKLEEQLAGTCKRLEQAQTEQCRFLSLVSHELRTPLNALVGFSHLLVCADELQMPGADRLAYVKNIQTGADRLMRLIDSALTFASTDFGRVQLDEKVFPLAHVIESARDACLADTRVSGVTIEAVADNDHTVQADMNHTEQMLVQLLRNAVHASPAGGVVTVSAQERDGCLQLAVEDQGTGFQTLDFKQLTTPFVCTGEVMTRRKDGIGLGLPLVNRLALMHGASLTLANRPEGGARASIVFPAYRTMGQTQKQAAPLTTLAS